MPEESKILESLVRRQVRFQEAIKKSTEKVRKQTGEQLVLPGLEPTVTETQKVAEEEK